MESNTRKQIGNRINAALASANMMQKELAKAIGVPDNTISYFASGSRVPNTEQIIKISKVLGVSTDYLLGLTDVPTNDKDVQFICDYTGLNNEVIKYFHNLLSVDCVFKNTYQHVFDEELTKELFISRFGKDVYDSAIEDIEINIKETKKICNNLFSSNIFGDLLYYEKRISALSNDMSLYLALFFNDLEFFEKQDDFLIHEPDKNIVTSVIEYLHDFLSAEDDHMMNSYHLQLFECQNATTEYIKNSYSALDKFANYSTPRIRARAYFTFLVGDAIDEALKSDNVLETLNKKIQEAHKRFTESEIDFFKKIFEEVKRNGND